MNCDRRLLSDYIDGELPAPTRRQVETHVASCPDCQAVLAQYRELGDALRVGACSTVPSELTERFRARLREPRPSLAARLAGLLHWPDFRQSLAFSAVGTAAAAVVLALVFALSPFTSGDGVVVVAAYPPDGAEDVVLDRPIQVEFNEPVAEDTSAIAVYLDPPVPVESRVEGNKLIVQPKEPLKPDTRYVVKIEKIESRNPVAPVALAPAPSPVTLNFSTGRSLAAVAKASPTAGAGPAVQPSPSAAPAPLLAAASPTQTVAVALASPTVTGGGEGAPSATPASAAGVQCERQPAGWLVGLSRERPEVSPKLGCATSNERSQVLLEQRFRGGAMLSVADRREIQALFADGRWAAYPDTYEPAPSPTPTSAVRPAPINAFGKLWLDRLDVRGRLGAPAAPEASLTVLIQEFAHGAAISRGDGSAYLLFDDGTWLGFGLSTPPTTVATRTPVLGTPEPTATVAPSPTPAPPSPTAATATVTPTPTPSPSATAPVTTETPTATPSATLSPTATAAPGGEGSATPTPDEAPATGTPAATETPPSEDEDPSATPTPTPTKTVLPTAPATPTGLATPTTTALPTGLATPTETALPTGTPTPQASPTPLAVGTAVGSPSPDPLVCDLPVVGSFARAHAGRAELGGRLGCPILPEHSIDVVEATYEGGYVYTRADLRQVYVLYAGGAWEIFPAVSRAGDLGRADTPSKLRPRPAPTAVSWRDNPEVVARLGQESAPEREFVGVAQPFERGLLLWSDARRVYALHADGTWESLPDPDPAPAEEP